MAPDEQKGGNERREHWPMELSREQLVGALRVMVNEWISPQRLTEGEEDVESGT